MATINVKISSNLVSKRNPETNRIEPDVDSINQIGQQVIALHEAGNNMGVVYSGAIAIGMSQEKIIERPPKSEMAELQWLSCVGNPVLFRILQEALGPITVGQLLLTRNDMNHLTKKWWHRSKPTREEALGTMQKAFESKNRGIWLANENDATAHEDITFGDNDILAAIITAVMKLSGKFGEDVKLVILSDVDGVYEDLDDETSLIRTIEDIEVYEHVIKPSDSDITTGGMRSKFEAAKIVTASGVDMWVANGHTPDVIQLALDGKTGTHFVAKPINR